MRYIRLTTLYLILLICGSCTGPGVPQTGNAGIVSPAAGQNIMLDGLPGISGLDTLSGESTIGRGTSEAFLAFDGIDFSLDSGGGNHVVSGTEAYALEVMGGSSAWAMYGFSIVPGQAPLRLRVHVTDEFSVGSQAAPSLEYWVGFSHYASDRWDWQGPFSTYETDAYLPAGEGAQYISPLDNTYCIILSYSPPGALGVYTAVENGMLVTDGPGSNTAPIPSLEATPLKGPPGQILNLDASGSMDPDGSIVNYEWDLDGDNLFGEAGVEAQASGQDIVNYSMISPGQWNITVRVTDDDGAASAFAEQVTCTGWQVLDLLSGATDIPDIYSLGTVHTSPALVYRLGNELRYAIASDFYGADPGSWIHITLEDFQGMPPSNTAPLAYINGHPALAWSRRDTKDLIYYYADTARGESPADWHSIVVDDYAGDVGLYCDLQDVNGYPAIAYSDLTNTMVRYAISSDPDGAADWTVVFVDNHDDSTFHSSLADSDSQPWILHERTVGSKTQLAVLQSSSVDGALWSDWGEHTILESLNTEYNMGQIQPVYDGFNSIAIVYHSWLTTSNQDFRVTYGYFDGVSGIWWFDDIEHTTDHSWYPQLELISGRPVVTYHSLSAGSVIVASNNSVDATLGTWTEETVESIPAVYNGRVLLDRTVFQPSVCYVDTARKVIRYAIRWN